MTFWIYFHNTEKYIFRVCYGECNIIKLLQNCQLFILIRTQDKKKSNAKFQNPIR